MLIFKINYLIVISKISNLKNEKFYFNENFNLTSRKIPFQMNWGYVEGDEQNHHS